MSDGRVAVVTVTARHRGKRVVVRTTHTATERTDGLPDVESVDSVKSFARRGTARYYARSIGLH
ncbi:MAG: hypothetical protein Q8M22_00450 [Actinomycetota bacterium]|nr:hypothetical protein [Actinomycetota bacterium]